MGWISAEMMRSRNSGAFDNYGEMLYAESRDAIHWTKPELGQLSFEGSK